LVANTEEGRLRPFDSRVLRRIFGPKIDEVTRGWRRLVNEQFNEFCSIPDIIRLVKYRIMTWAVHVARRGRGKLHVAFWWGNLRERDQLLNPGVDVRIILKSIFIK